MRTFVKLIGAVMMLAAPLIGILVAYTYANGPAWIRFGGGYALVLAGAGCGFMLLCFGASLLSR